MSEANINPTEQSYGEKPVNASRRKLTGAVLAGPVVLGTLASKQALGGVPYHCTISGQISGTASVRPGTTTLCDTLGRSPGFWKNHWTCWDLDGVVGSTTVEGPFRPFNAIFTGSSITDRMGDILENCPQPNKPLERAAIASYLNAKHFPNSYPLTTAQVLAMYANAGSGAVGNFASLQGYFESLYEDSDEWPAGASNTTCPSDAQGFSCSTPTPGSTLSGVLTLNHGRTISDIISIRLGTTLCTLNSLTSASGSYTCAVSPGTYTLSVAFNNPGNCITKNAVRIDGGNQSVISPATKSSITVTTSSSLPPIIVKRGGTTSC